MIKSFVLLCSSFDCRKLCSNISPLKPHLEEGPSEEQLLFQETFSTFSSSKKMYSALTKLQGMRQRNSSLLVIVLCLDTYSAVSTVRQNTDVYHTPEISLSLSYDNTDVPG